MPKKPTGLAPKGGKKSSIEKEAVPMKTPALGAPKLPVPMTGSTNMTASMPGMRSQGGLSRPAKLAPRTPRI